LTDHIRTVSFAACSVQTHPICIYYYLVGFKQLTDASPCKPKVIWANSAYATAIYNLLRVVLCILCLSVENAETNILRSGNTVRKKKYHLRKYKQCKSSGALCKASGGERLSRADNYSVSPAQLAVALRPHYLVLLETQINIICCHKNGQVSPPVHAVALKR